MRPGRFVRGVLGAACVLALAGSHGCASLRSRFDPCGRLLPTPPGSKVLLMDFSPEGGGFRVGLPPTKPAENTEGSRLKTYRWFVFNEGQYEIGYSDADRALEDPAVSAVVLDRMKESALSQGARRLEAERELRLGTHPGRELLLRDDYGILIRRFYLAGSRIYVVSASVSSKMEGCALDGVLKNLDSFEILEGEAPASPTPGAK